MSSLPCFSVRSAAACLCLGLCAHGAAGAADRSAAAAPDPVTAQAGLPTGDSDGFRRHMESWLRSPGATPAKLNPVETFVAAKPRSISSGFGWRIDPINGVRHRHAGIDLPGTSGTPVFATGAGIVSIAGWIQGYGNLVQLDHPGGLSTRYGHLSRILVARGEPVGQGELIGKMGSTGHSTGPHVHYEVRVNGSPVNPMLYTGQTVPDYQPAWAPEPVVTARWTGWQEKTSELPSLPEAKIR
jgi:murein DD-endopeptidase MepM/ murein hydrolase activator NlpD